MANLKKIKNEALHKAQGYKTKEDATSYQKEKKEEIRQLIQSVKRSGGDELAKRRLIAGLEVLLAEAEEDYVYAKSIYDIGKQMERDAAGQLSREEKRIIKAKMQEIKDAARYTKQRIRSIGKERDASRKRVSSYLKKQIGIAWELYSGRIDNIHDAINQSGRVV